MATTIKDIARQAGVSAATVSKVLNRKDQFISEETREKIWSLVKELDYTPNSIARSLITRSSRVIGIIVPDILNAYFTELVRACDQAARERGYSTILCNSDSDPAKETSHLTFLASHGVDGIVLAASDLIPDARLLEKLRIPLVSMDREVPDLDCLAARIDTDYETGAYLSASHLIRNGHRRIAFVSGNPLASNTRIRRAGFERAHCEAGLPVDPDLIECGAFNHRFGLMATRTLLDRTRFTAMCCMSDMLAMGAMVGLREHGLSVPDDCAVMGFDNIYIAPLLVRPLSTIERRISEAGSLAIGAMIDFLDDPERPRRTVLMEPTVILRETT
ncbi:LacI family DNA-binding transcriptional regulator [Mesorhizobium humile]|uniref:LacI family DNA-binding transcriptional regulator n=1 Tax=Mesorhizobium humile TaxID=3072313 RepID=A0ABU4YST3_9HYPH|nr:MULTISPECIES: LacI family DNA-binding transcriptional regulator [unclassified Mesorhizobium]MDX8461324.1 LacI family DNA-binding transcriptional regulator [Mesorhizobium sp. VK2D]MDX8488934.1 LacI family DNA-binding transcriptional regulator [Mesorhizobium sp. VK2B]